MKDTWMRIRINAKTKKELKEIAEKTGTTMTKIVDECIRKIIEKNYKLLEK